jgi:hypothetical protein
VILDPDISVLMRAVSEAAMRGNRPAAERELQETGEPQLRERGKCRPRACNQRG